MKTWGNGHWTAVEGSLKQIGRSERVLGINKSLFKTFKMALKLFILLIYKLI